MMSVLPAFPEGQAHHRASALCYKADAYKAIGAYIFRRASEGDKMRNGHSIAAIFCATWFSAAASIAAEAQNQAAPADASTGTVDDQRLHAAARAEGDWITFGRDYSNQRFAPLHAIDRGNVARLAPAWVYQL